MLVLAAHLLRYEQWAATSFQHRIAINFARMSRMIRPSPCPRDFELAPAVFKLGGVGIAADHDSGALGRRR